MNRMIRELASKATKIAKARAALDEAQKNLMILEKEYENLSQETESLVEQSGKGFSRTLYYQEKAVKVAKQSRSWVIIRNDKSREHYDSLRQIRLGIVAGTISI